MRAFHNLQILNEYVFENMLLVCDVCCYMFCMVDVKSCVSLTSLTQFKHCKSQNDFVFIRGTKSCIKGFGVLHKGSPFVSIVSLQFDFYCTVSGYACCLTNSRITPHPHVTYLELNHLHDICSVLNLGLV